jgi:uroporphyrinogen decarboxylase
MTTLEFREPDRVPIFHSFTLHGAKELGISIREYFSKPENIVTGQLKLRKKYRNDCVVGALYTALEMEAWGQEVIFYDDGPPNTGAPFIKNPEQILSLSPPKVGESPCLLKALEVIERLYEKVGDEAPILAVAISPFSMPIMQMGFDKYLDLLYYRPDLAGHLLKLNEEFCVNWANAQLKAGATAIAYYDPMSSPTISSEDLFQKWGLPIARRVFAGMNGPVGVHTASGRILPLVEELIDTSASMFGVSALEDLSEAKRICDGRAVVMGNLNGIEMRRWTEQDAAQKVKEAIAKGGPGGGFVLSDNHGEIPWQVPDNVLMAITETVEEWGVYPLTWAKEYET